MAQGSRAKIKHNGVWVEIEDFQQLRVKGRRPGENPGFHPVIAGPHAIHVKNGNNWLAWFF